MSKPVKKSQLKAITKDLWDKVKLNYANKYKDNHFTSKTTMANADIVNVQLGRNTNSSLNASTTTKMNNGQWFLKRDIRLPVNTYIGEVVVGMVSSAVVGTEVNNIFIGACNTGTGRLSEILVQNGRAFVEENTVAGINTGLKMVRIPVNKVVTAESFLAIGVTGGAWSRPAGDTSWTGTSNSYPTVGTMISNGQNPIWSAGNWYGNAVVLGVVNLNQFLTDIKNQGILESKELTGTVDLNTITKVGTYHRSANATVLTNAPFGPSGHFSLLVIGKDLFPTQIATEIYSTRTKIRSKTHHANDTWTPWEDFGAGGTSITVVNDLTTGGTTSVLSAEQGKVLDGKITTHENDIATDTTVGHVKGDGRTTTIEADGSIVATPKTTAVVVNDLITDSDIDAVSAAMAKALNDRLSKLDTGVAIPNGADLNNYKTAGVYTTANSSITRSLLNAPADVGAGSGARLIITHGAATSACIQRMEYVAGNASSNNARRVFQRAFNGDWSPWTMEVHALYGTGSPNGTATAPVGSIYFDIDGTSHSVLYIKESGTGNTGWVAK